MDAAENTRRTERYRKDESIEAALGRLNDLLAAAEQPPDAAFDAPVLLVVGPPRAGTTLLVQTLARGYDVTCADNVVARFWGAPHVGVAVSRSLRAQLGDPGTAYASEHGVTGALFDPHEFGYFWERFLPFDSGHRVPDARLAAVDWARLRRELAAMQRAGGGRPLVLKAVPLSLIIETVARELPEAVFVEARRDPRFVTRSILRTRVQRYGDVSAWWSVKPPDWRALAALPPAESAAAQVRRITDAVRAALDALPPERRAVVRYDALCAGPRAALAGVERAVAARGGRLEPRGELPETFACADRAAPDDPDFAAVSRAVERWFGP